MGRAKSNFKLRSGVELRDYLTFQREVRRKLQIADFYRELQDVSLLRLRTPSFLPMGRPRFGVVVSIRDA